MLREDVETKLRSLTVAECRVLYWVCSGLYRKEIAAKLGKSESDIYFHLGHIYEKLGLKTLNGYQRQAALTKDFCPVLLDLIRDPNVDCLRLKKPQPVPGVVQPGEQPPTGTEPEKPQDITDGPAGEEPVSKPPDEVLALVRADEERGLIPIQRAIERYERHLPMTPPSPAQRRPLLFVVLLLLAAAVAGSVLTLVLVTLIWGPPARGRAPTVIVVERTMPPAPTYTIPPTYTAAPSPTPWPTYTLAPTFTPQPVVVVVVTAAAEPQSARPPTAAPVRPTPTPLPADTPANAQLEVGQPWIQRGVWLTLENAALAKDVWYWHEFTFYIENKTGGEIIFTPDDAAIEMLNQDRVVVMQMHSYRNPSPPNRLAAGAGKRFVVGFNSMQRFDPVSTSVSYFFIRVSNFSRLTNAVWRIVPPH